MFDHVTISVSDGAASERFYRTVLATLGIEPSHASDELMEWDDFSLVPTDREHPVTRGLVGADGSFSLNDDGGPLSEHVHLAFPASDDATVRAFHAAGSAAGHADHGAPGERPVYHAGYDGAFLLDPDGNNVEVVNHNRS